MRIFDELRAYSVRNKPKHESYKAIYAVIIFFLLQWIFLVWNTKECETYNAFLMKE